MKRVCFIEMEGILLSHEDYSTDSKRVFNFVDKLATFCKKEKVVEQEAPKKKWAVES
ncbi:MAG: hypothetical protein HN878_03280, partial [Candidatus Diapherotrites archaeon]|nr:hypothetical protein [Candidatus Diapherotrites archaeon]